MTLQTFIKQVRKATGVRGLTLLRTFIFALRLFRENNPFNRKGPRNCQMFEKRNPFLCKNTHDLLVGTLSIGIPSCKPLSEFSNMAAPRGLIQTVIPVSSKPKRIPTLECAFSIKNTILRLHAKNQPNR